VLAFFFIPMPHAREIHYLEIVFIQSGQKVQVSKIEIVRILSGLRYLQFKAKLTPEGWFEKIGGKK